MISRRICVVSLAVGTLLATVLPVSAKSKHVNLIRLLDTDNDGTVDLAEAKAAASAMFDRLERDKDGTLDKHELSRRLFRTFVAVGRSPHDGAWAKEEYVH